MGWNNHSWVAVVRMPFRRSTVCSSVETYHELLGGLMMAYAQHDPFLEPSCLGGTFLYYITREIQIKPILPTSQSKEKWSRDRISRQIKCAIDLRDRNCLRPKKFTRTIEILSSEKTHLAEDYLLRTAQQDVFRTELNILRRDDRNATIPKQSQLYQLNPFIDEKGLLRMHVEIANPIILPRDHPITNLIVESYHQKFDHQNHESVINEVRQKYCISCLRRVYAKVRSNCQRCRLREARPRPPAMADLPKCRLAAFVRPFTHTGIDYFGPMEVAIGRRVEKRWGVLLTCLTIRGVYLDLASSLTTSSCIMVIRNFIVQRGTPSVFYSDRRTNFIGADRELKQALQDVDQHKMAQEFVSSVKRTLVELHLPHRPKEEELRSALVEIEGILNARQLTHVPIEDDAAPALTPNHWLLGSSDGFKPWTELEVNSIALNRGWHLSQQIANHFWKRWLREYLPEITRRSKWHQNVPPIKEGDIVVIVDSDLPRNAGSSDELSER
ncbi:uncharacterized protein LOC129742717 [Uranotaenia lowii]|uniref:uncharacterized protein LOC129742717 n=1 Tax=Uranotaenia lowii TaxID=190385 RepID=UPI00247AE074|nr:uncharacterized protein LOC129742717 [Uranotaenia lowii]